MRSSEQFSICLLEHPFLYVGFLSRTLSIHRIAVERGEGGGGGAGGLSL